MNYNTPQEGARLMYDTIATYMRDVLLAKPTQLMTPLEEERNRHDLYRMSRLAMGGVYVGGENYVNLIDEHVKSSGGEEGCRHLVIQGDAGKV